ncbi:MAG: hypothetical protein H6993_06450 [Pseudomonadales bacterium]|nr:hypothetical protein [Pseudomonadales bacterium]MCP5183585.1 hypothetical protein [Pseudomonadales bacterium]
MGVTTTMVLYSAVGLVLAAGGVLVILRGYGLVQAADDHEVRLGSLTLAGRTAGVLLMSTAFVWALAAVLVMPDYLDAEVAFKQLQSTLEARDEAYAALERQAEQRQALLNAAERTGQQATAEKAALRQAVDERLQEQMARISELRSALRRNNTAAALRSASKLEQLTLAIRATMRDG